jgi:hypothetical protein
LSSGGVNNLNAVDAHQNSPMRQVKSLFNQALSIRITIKRQILPGKIHVNFIECQTRINLRCCGNSKARKKESN